MRGRTAGLALALALSVVVGAGCNRVHTERIGPEPAAGPNVVLVTIDTLRADHVGAYGADFAQTPVLDAFAADGTRFETVISAAPLTLPAHASILTGDFPPRHGVRHNGLFRLDGSLPTLAERFQSRGFATGAVVGAMVLGSRYGLGRGFDRYDDHVGMRQAGTTGYLERSAGEVTDAALAWLASVGNRPFFLWVHYYDPHMEYHAPAAFTERLPGRPYDAEIAYVDHELGRLHSTLASAGLEGSTVWAVIADHGDSLGEHGELNHGMTLYDGVMQVPLLLSGPGVPAGRVVHGVVRSVDLAPTLLALAGLPPLPDTDGESLVPLLEPGAGDSTRWAYSETLLPQLDFGWAPLHAVRTARELYVRAPRPELYDLAADPGEQHDLLASDASKPPDEAAHVSELDARIDTVLATTKQAERLAIDSAERARLQALGYALPEGPVESTGLDPKDGLRYQRLIQEGTRAFVEQRYGEAEKDLREFLQHAPASARAHGLLASTLLYTGRAGEGLTHADQAVGLAPDVAYHYTERAEIRIVLGDPDGAQADFEKAASLDLDGPYVQVGLMWIQTRQPGRPGALAQAVEHARRAFELAPHDAFVRLRVGLIWLGIGAYQPALDSFADAVRLRPDFALAQARLAIEYARIGHIDDALQHRALAGRWLDDPVLGSELAFAIAAGGDRETGRAHIAALERSHPGDPHVARARKRIAALPSRPAPVNEGKGS